MTLACAAGGASDSGGTDKVIEVDCIGLVLEAPNAHQRLIKTRNSDRCFGSISDTTWGGDLTISHEALVPDNGIALLITHAGHTYVPQVGRITLNWIEGDVYGAGDYDVTAIDEDGNEVQLRGAIDMCAFADSQQCPYKSGSGGLTKNVGLSAPDNYNVAFEESWSTDCRVLLDRDREAVQVDLEFGVINGTNAAMSWLNCDMNYLISNHFVFRSGGVPGPGTYDYVTQAVADPADPYGMDSALGLPGFALQIPMVTFGGSCFLETHLLAVGDHATGDSLMAPEPYDPTECSFTIEEDPGRFQLDCTNARKRSVPSQGLPTVGDFHLEADCDVRDAP